MGVEEKQMVLMPLFAVGEVGGELVCSDSFMKEAFLDMEGE
jgi:hypothetical protein